MVPKESEQYNVYVLKARFPYCRTMLLESTAGMRNEYVMGVSKKSTAPSVPKQSPIQVLTGPNVA